jgi:hypothetical protein
MRTSYVSAGMRRVHGSRSEELGCRAVSECP